MKILIKMPTRQRPEKFLETLNKYITYASNISNITFLITADEDDITMNNSNIKSKLSMLSENINLFSFFGKSKNKIEAINSDINKFHDWDILLLASDDMHPLVSGYDEIIIRDMTNNFPDTDGVLWYPDGGNNLQLNTISILGKKYYERFNYVYNPEYKSLWCDNEFTSVSLNLNKCFRSDVVLIEHKHPAWQKGETDNLYAKNDSYHDEDKQTYLKRAENNFDLNKRKLITYCVYGTNPMYQVGALRNAESALKLYPGWICRFYVFKECQHIIPKLKEYPNTEIVFCNQFGNNHSMMTRFLPFQETDVSYFISRDTDSRLSIREKEAVVEWISSGKTFHIMKDQPSYHRTPIVPILGGMFGAKGGCVPHITNLIKDHIGWHADVRGSDQSLLYNIYHNYAINDNITHDCQFPTPRNFERDKIWFVGQPINEHDEMFGPLDDYLKTLNEQ